MVRTYHGPGYNPGTVFMEFRLSHRMEAYQGDFWTKGQCQLLDPSPQSTFSCPQSTFSCPQSTFSCPHRLKSEHEREGDVLGSPGLGWRGIFVGKDICLFSLENVKILVTP